MSYDRIWIQSSEHPGGWLERRVAEKRNLGNEFEGHFNRLYAQGHFVVLVAGGDFCFDELFLFDDASDAAAFYETGFKAWESFIGDDDEGCGFQEVSLYQDGRRVAIKSCEPTRGNSIDMQLDVLASSPEEINKIEAALQQPCEDQLAWVAQKIGNAPKEFVEEVIKSVAFRPTRNLAQMDPSVNTARRFSNEVPDYVAGVVRSHVYFVSEAFPEAIFLMSHWDTGISYAGKSVIRGGREIRHVHDGNQQSQGREWVKPNIFAPYEAEFNNGVEFGSLWSSWLVETEAAIAKLKERYGTPNAGATCQSALPDWERG